MPVKFKSYIFDLDGTLTDSSYALWKGVASAMLSIGVDNITQDDVCRWIGRPLIEVFEGFIRERGNETILDDSIFSKMAKIFRDEHDRNFPSGVVIYPGVVDLLIKLRSENAKIAIATNKFQEPAEFVTKGLDLFDKVDAVCGVEPGFPAKPDPYVFQEALRLLDASPESTLVIGDTISDMQAGKSAGCKCGFVTYGYGDLTTLDPDQYDFRFDKISEVP
ncbi:MAG: HAD family hydrolase [Candidatus Electryonea clarkiae]|nr:HAD family hydrolase [Candidatus Electryonea clarkiae]MDP8287230.1 HAD family hydrolase [Candidatus Electryonea clarkiae]